jgi:hypothetical protein
MNCRNYLFRTRRPGQPKSARSTRMARLGRYVHTVSLWSRSLPGRRPSRFPRSASCSRWRQSHADGGCGDGRRDSCYIGRSTSWARASRPWTIVAPRARLDLRSHSNEWPCSPGGRAGDSHRWRSFRNLRWGDGFRRCLLVRQRRDDPVRSGMFYRVGIPYNMRPSSMIVYIEGRPSLGLGKWPLRDRPRHALRCGARIKRPK